MTTGFITRIGIGTRLGWFRPLVWTLCSCWRGKRWRLWLRLLFFWLSSKSIKTVCVLYQHFLPISKVAARYWWISLRNLPACGVPLFRTPSTKWWSSWVRYPISSLQIITSELNLVYNYGCYIYYWFLIY